MEEIDIYSNMLYVMDKRAKLGKLAHEYAELDRNRAEVCCLIGESSQSSSGMTRLCANPCLAGNYYSSRGEHTKAIIYFKRSLLLNREYLPAWTLMGHEFVELKNSHAAIEAYRKAVGGFGMLLSCTTSKQRYGKLVSEDDSLTVDCAHRCQPKGLPRLVRSRPGLRAAGYAQLRHRVLQPGYLVETLRLPNVDRAGYHL
jgi:anaphase-promoting complex subunit 8